jgi:hypothetical protein
MGTRKKPEPQKLQSETNYQGAFQSYGVTPEEQELKDYSFDDSRFDAGTASAFGKARQDIVEGVGGYAGINNPVLEARMKEIALQELADQESSALTAAEKERNALKLQNKQFLASLRRPQYVQTGQSGFQEQFAPQGQSILGSIIGGGATIGAAF